MFSVGFLAVACSLDPSMGDALSRWTGLEDLVMESRKTEGAFMWPSNPVVPYGPADDVELELKNKMEEFAKKGGSSGIEA